MDAFAEQGLKVVDVALGANHSVAITSINLIGQIQVMEASGHGAGAVDIASLS